MLKKILTWMIIFSALSATTYYTLTPNEDLKASLAHAAETNRSGVLLSVEERQEESAFKRISNRFNRLNMFCTLTEDQERYLSENYDTELETVMVEGEEVRILKIERETPSNLGEIRRYLRETSEERCLIIPTRSWFYIVAGVGSIS